MRQDKQTTTLRHACSDTQQNPCNAGTIRTLVIKGGGDVALLDLFHNALMAAARSLSEIIAKCGSVKLFGLQPQQRQNNQSDAA